MRSRSRYLPVSVAAVSADTGLENWSKVANYEVLSVAGLTDSSGVSVLSRSHHLPIPVAVRLSATRIKMGDATLSSVAGLVDSSGASMLSRSHHLPVGVATRSGDRFFAT